MGYKFKTLDATAIMITVEELTQDRAVRERVRALLVQIENANEKNWEEINRATDAKAQHIEQRYHDIEQRYDVVIVKYERMIQSMEETWSDLQRKLAANEGPTNEELTVEKELRKQYELDHPADFKFKDDSKFPF